MRRVGKGFSGVETPPFDTMLAVRDVDEDAEAQVPAQGDDVQEHDAEEVATNVISPIPTSQSPSSCLENANAAQQLEIVKLKARVKKLEKLNQVKSSKLRQLKKVVAASTTIPAAKPKTLTITAAPASREEMEKEDEEIIKSINETPAQKAAKRRKLSEEAQEADDLRKRLEIVRDEDDDVFVEATPLAQKVPVMDYQSYAAEGFEQIIDFLSGSYINHALTVNPYVNISCIKQFWNTDVVKRSARMGYEKPSTKLTFYKAFFLTQWKFLIHTILHSLSAKRTSWNEFSSAMASALICLSSGQRFNFTKVGKGFSGVETPLFESMLAVRDVAEEAEAQVPAQCDDVQEHAVEEVATDAVSPTPTSQSPSSPVIPSSPPHQPPWLKDEGIELVTNQEKDAKVEGRHADKQAEIY
nr:hypothetical protein [Tanacetum cinerariifolium]